MKVLFTPTGRQQLLAVVAHILRENPAAAVSFRKNSARVLRRLARFPQSGRHIPEFPDLPHRELVVPPYRFFYRVHEDTVWVIAVWHGAQLPDEPGE